MAAFTDQFTRHSPLTFRSGRLFGDRLSIAISSARDVLDGRSADDIGRIAKRVSKLIDQAAHEYGQEHTEHEAEELAEAYPELSPTSIALVQAENAFELSRAVREEFGELGLFLGLEPSRTRQVGDAGAVAFERAEALATLSLWLAVDCMDEVAQEPRTRTIDGEPAQYGAVPAALAMDAMRASAMAVEAASRHADLEALRDEGASTQTLATLEIQDLAQQQRYRHSAKKGANARWDHLPKYKAKAFAASNSKLFESRAAAAKFAAEQLDPKPRPKKAKDDDPDEYYPWTKVDEWIAAMNWDGPEAAALRKENSSKRDG